ncbi:MAG: hypothetical protein KGQ49_06075 [Verrucomicrobia bacterium]|nr:hypothetical protein [Verrucomicrobiota bacterium]MBU6446947.1 hypothetical protein [Verrucomicrobiota bacterium]MDE3046937.1 hypothetical protein [Verrucomicrobiota bacterium]
MEQITAITNLNVESASLATPMSNTSWQQLLSETADAFTGQLEQVNDLIRAAEKNPNQNKAELVALGQLKSDLQNAQLQFEAYETLPPSSGNAQAIAALLATTSVEGRDLIPSDPNASRDGFATRADSIYNEFSALADQFENMFA